MANVNDLSNEDLAHTLSEWMGDAANSWQYFSAEEKRYFRIMQDEVCKRFIAEYDTE